MLDKDDADAAGLQRQANPARPGMMCRKRRVQGRGRVGHAEGGRPDQPHAVTAADGQQFRAGCRVQAGRGHGQGLHAPLPAVFGDGRHGRGRRGDDRQIDRLRQCGRQRHPGHAADLARLQLARPGIDRVDPSGEAGVDDVL
jgi:hypothetical protein